MQRIILASLMALFFGLFSMPASQAAMNNGAVIGKSANTLNTIDKVQWRRRRRRRCGWVHRYRSRRRWYCW